MRPDRRGVALLMALLVLAVAGTFIVAGFYAARSDDRADRLAFRVAQLDAAGQGAVAVLVATWDSAARFAQAVGTSAPVALPAPDVDTEIRVRLLRLSTYLYMAAVRVRDARDTAVAAAGSSLLRVEAPGFPAFAAMTARGDVGPPGAIAYLPADQMAGRACGAPPLPGPVFPGFAVPPGRSAPFPSVQVPEAGEDSTYRRFGGVSLDALAARAGWQALPGLPVPAPVASIALASGDLTLAWGNGRGVLVVLGRLTIQGPVTYRGVIVAQGGVEVRPPGAMLEGLVLAGGGSPPGVVANQNGYINLRFDPCLVADVAWHAGRVRPDAGWEWQPTP